MYVVTTKSGTLTIEKATITITVNNRTATYNGKAVTINNKAFKHNSPLDISITLVIKEDYYERTGTYLKTVGSTKLYVDPESVVILNDKGVNITDCFDLEADDAFVDGTLTIKKRKITLKPADLVVPYNGETYTESSLTLDDYVLQGNDRIINYRFDAFEAVVENLFIHIHMIKKIH